MPRTFASASSEKVDLALGAGASITGAVTLAAVFKKSTDGVLQNVLSIGTTAATARRLICAAANTILIRSGNATRGSTTTLTTASGWVFVAATKAAGTTTPRFHFYVYSTNTWTHENGGDTLTDSTPDTASAIASAGAAGFFNGDIAVAGAYASDMTDAQVESMAFGLDAWFQIQPNGLWLLDQSATSMLVNDLTGGGANQTAITGTTVGTSAVPVFSYGAPVRTIQIQPAAAFTGNLVTTGELRLISTAA